MNFLWPTMLWLLLCVPALIALYVVILRRGRRASLARGDLSMLRLAAERGTGLRRHVPALLLLLALTALLAAVARPTVEIRIPSREQTVVLAIDVSGSMRATDIEPTRLAAAQAAARAFVERQPRHVRIGVVAFASTASLVQAPTDRRDEILAAIDRLQPQYGTAIGSAIVVALATIFPNTGIEEILPLDGAPPQGLERGGSRPQAPSGAHDFAAIILLTDGQSNAGPDPVDAARIAADFGVRVYTVGVGTVAGEVLQVEGWSMRVGLDEDSLRAIADHTRGNYYQAQDADELMQIYRRLETRFAVRAELVEVTGALTGAGALLALISAFLSLLWFNRIL